MGTTKRERQKAGRQARLEAARIAERRARRRRTVITSTIVVVLVVVAAFLFAVLGGNKKKADVSTATTTTGSKATSSTPSTGASITGDTPCPQADGSSPRTTFFALAPPTCIDPAKTYTATFKTSEGDITFALDTKTTPQTTNNFVVLSRYHYYDGTQLFRTDTSIGIIQGGAATTNNANDPGPGYTIKDEGGTFDFSGGGNGKGPFTYVAGDLMMARAATANSSAAQFFFAVNDSVKNLDQYGTYIKFGHVTAGQDVLTKILALNVDDPSSGLGGHPSKTVTVESVTIQES